MSSVVNSLAVPRRLSRRQQLPVIHVAAPQATPISSGEENGVTTNTGVLLVQCPDAKGVVAALAQLLFGFNCNILQSDQFSDESLAQPRFFQRIHFDFSDISVGTGNLAVLETAVAELAKRYQMDWKVRLGSVVEETERFRVDAALYGSRGLQHRIWQACQFDITW